MAVCSALYILALINPRPVFSYEHTYKQFHVYSDAPIPNVIEAVLDKALLNIERSELYDSAEPFNIFICNKSWRFGLFARNTKLGGSVTGIVSPNIFIRNSEIDRNTIIPPGDDLLDAENRPLSYFLAHEMTHAMQARYDRFMMIKVPPAVMEGYADYIGKGQNFDHAQARARLIKGHEFMRGDSPLYDRYHLYIAHLIEVRGLSFKDILQNSPDLEAVMDEIKTET